MYAVKMSFSWIPHEFYDNWVEQNVIHNFIRVGYLLFIYKAENSYLHINMWTAWKRNKYHKNVKCA